MDTISIQWCVDIFQKSIKILVVNLGLDLNDMLIDRYFLYDHHRNLLNLHFLFLDFQMYKQLQPSYKFLVYLGQQIKKSQHQDYAQ